MDGSITVNLAKLKSGDEDAAQKIWESYFRRVITLAKRNLPVNLRAEDQEDLAQDAMASFFRGARQDRFRELENRDDVWQLLVMLTIRKASRLRDHANAQKRRAERTVGESIFGRMASGEKMTLADVVESEPTAGDLEELSGQCEDLLNSLPDENHRKVALMKLEGYTHEEIRERLDCSLSWVERKVANIKKVLSEELDDNS